MREFSVPPTAEVSADVNTTTALWQNADQHPDSPLFAVPDGDEWRDVSTDEFRDQVVAVAKGLAEHGIEPGDRVGLMSRTRYEWTLFDYAIWTAGAVTVPVYDTVSAELTAWILSDSGAKACIVELPEHAARVEQVRGELPALEHVWQLEGGEEPAVEVLTAAGADGETDVEQLRTSRGRDDLATLVYTSGTTGKPKGCELTHGNLVADIANILPGMRSMFDHTSSTLMFLPLAHVLARIIQVGAVQARVKVGHIPDRTQLVSKLPGFAPTFLVAVPRVFEKVYNAAEQKAEDGGKGKIFAMAASTAIAYSRAMDAGGPGLGLKLRRALFDKLVYAKLRTVLGGRCDRALSGGAPLSERLAHFFRGIGVTVFEGYGLTETAPVVTLNIEGAHRIGTVGRPTPGTTVRLGDGDELQVKGPQVFTGYWQNPEATAEVLSDGWFATGDVAEIDSEGFVEITGRCKELLVTSSGKNVAPAPLENALRAHPLVGQCVVVGDDRPFVGALVALDHEALPAWLERTGRPADTTIAQLREEPEVKAEIDEAVKAANAVAISKAESIKAWRILPAALTEESGEITPKQSVKRSVVLSKYADDFEAIYSG